MAEFERTRVREREAPTQNNYEIAIQTQRERAERNAIGRIVCKLGDCPQMLTRQGRLRYYLGHTIKDTPLQDWICFTHEIRTVSGKHRHQGGLIIYVIEGKGSVARIQAGAGKRRRVGRRKGQECQGWFRGGRRWRCSAARLPRCMCQQSRRPRR